MTKIDDAINNIPKWEPSIWINVNDISPAIKKAIADYLNMIKRTAAITPREEDLVIAIKKELCGEGY